MIAVNETFNGPSLMGQVPTRMIAVSLSFHHLSLQSSVSGLGPLNVLSFHHRVGMTVSGCKGCPCRDDCSNLDVMNG